MDIQKLKARKKELGYTNQQVSLLTGVPLGTVQKIFGSSTRTPRRETYLALARILDPEEAKRMEYGASVVSEKMFQYNAIPKKKQGEYTVADYEALPDERRVELIDGVIYDMAAPSSLHQFLAGEVFRQLWDCVEEHGMDCFPAISPIDVQLDRDERTIVQPDVIIVRDMEKLLMKRIYGAPEFILEVLSPSTRSKDQVLKLNKYLKAGCEEYWVVDPLHRHVLVYDFRKEGWPEVYSFEDDIPVAISEGKCTVRFGKISQMIRRFFPEWREDDERLDSEEKR